MRRENQGGRRFACLLSVLLGLIFCRYALQVNIPRAVFLGILTVMAVWGTQTEILALFLTLIPLHESVDFYYALLICLGIYVWKYYRKIRIHPAVLLVLGLILWELLHCFSPELSFLEILIPILPLLVLAVVLASDLSETDYGFLIRAFASSTASIGITMLGQVLYWCDFNLVRTAAQLRRLGVVLESSGGRSAITGGTIQTNSLGIICVLAITGLLQLRSVRQNRTSDTVLILLLLTLGALTSSRTFLLCLAMAVFLFVLGQEGGFSRKLRFFGCLAVLGALVLVLMQLFFPELLEYYVGRFSERDITTGRDVLMQRYHRFIIRNPKVLYFGIGLQSYGHKLTEGYRVASNVPHNSIQEVLIAWGLPGLLLCAALVLAMMGKAGKGKLLNYIPLVILLFKSMAGQLLTSGYSLLALTYCYLSLGQDFNPGEKKGNLTNWV